jgi:hypothetical protein
MYYKSVVQAIHFIVNVERREFCQAVIAAFRLTSSPFFRQRRRRSMNESVANYSIVRIFWNGKPMPLPIAAAARRPRLIANHFYPRSRFD